MRKIPLTTARWRGALTLYMCRYDREEHDTANDADGSSMFYGEDSSYQKKEAELAKRLVAYTCFCFFSSVSAMFIFILAFRQGKMEPQWPLLRARSYLNWRQTMLSGRTDNSYDLELWGELRFRWNLKRRMNEELSFLFMVCSLNFWIGFVIIA